MEPRWGDALRQRRVEELEALIRESQEEELRLAEQEAIARGQAVQYERKAKAQRARTKQLLHERERIAFLLDPQPVQLTPPDQPAEPAAAKLTRYSVIGFPAGKLQYIRTTNETAGRLQKNGKWVSRHAVARELQEHGGGTVTTFDRATVMYGFDEHEKGKFWIEPFDEALAYRAPAGDWYLAFITSGRDGSLVFVDQRSTAFFGDSPGMRIGASPIVLKTQVLDGRALAIYIAELHEAGEVRGVMQTSLEDHDVWFDAHTVCGADGRYYTFHRQLTQGEADDLVRRGRLEEDEQVHYGECWNHRGESAIPRGESAIHRGESERLAQEHAGRHATSARGAA